MTRVDIICHGLMSEAKAPKSFAPAFRRVPYARWVPMRNGWVLPTIHVDFLRGLLLDAGWPSRVLEGTYEEPAA